MKMTVELTKEIQLTVNRTSSLKIYKYIGDSMTDVNQIDFKIFRKVLLVPEEFRKESRQSSVNLIFLKRC